MGSAVEGAGEKQQLGQVLIGMSKEFLFAKYLEFTPGQRLLQRSRYNSYILYI